MKKALRVSLTIASVVGAVIYFVAVFIYNNQELKKDTQSTNSHRRLTPEYVDKVRNDVWQEANKLRFAPLSLDPVLNETATKKCQKIASTGKAEHGDLLAELSHLNRHHYGENLVEFMNVGDEEVSGKQAVDSWFDSPGHRRNLLDPSWGRVGYGVCNSEKFDLVVVQQFSD